MVKVNIQEAKTHLSRYIDSVEHGEVVVVCRHNKPVAEIRAITSGQELRKREPGLLKGQIHWAPGTFDPMSDEELAEFDGPVFPPAQFAVAVEPE